MESLDIAAIGCETFTPHTGSQFTIAVNESEQTIALTLEEAYETPDHRPDHQRVGRKPFCLVFSCATHPLGQGSYHLNHEALPPFVAFLSPFETYENGHKLEAIFA